MNRTFITALRFSVFKLSGNPWGADSRPLNPFSRTAPEFIAQSTNKMRLRRRTFDRAPRWAALRGGGSSREQPPARPRPQVLGPRELLQTRAHPIRHRSSRVQQLIGRVCAIDHSRSDRARFYALDLEETSSGLHPTTNNLAGQQIAHGGKCPRSTALCRTLNGRSGSL